MRSKDQEPAPLSAIKQELLYFLVSVQIIEKILTDNATLNELLRLEFEIRTSRIALHVVAHNKRRYTSEWRRYTPEKKNIADRVLHSIKKSLYPLDLDSGYVESLERGQKFQKKAEYDRLMARRKMRMASRAKIELLHSWDDETTRQALLDLQAYNELTAKDDGSHARSVSLPPAITRRVIQ